MNALLPISPPSLVLLILVLILVLLESSSAGAFVTTTKLSVSDPGRCFVRLHAEIPRRKFQAGCLGGLLGGEILSVGGRRNPGCAADAFVTNNNNNNNRAPLVDVPMIRLRLPRGGFGREYIALKMKIQDQGPFEFMVDSGLTTELITPHLQGILGIQDAGSNRLSGIAGGGETVPIPVVELAGLSIDVGNGKPGPDLPKLRAVITDFPQEHIDPAHDPVEGMVGMEFLSLFDVDLDFLQNRIRLFEPGSADTTGLSELPAVVINESMLLGIRVSTPDKPSGQQQPVLGFLDCGSTFSCINWKAAQVLGLPPRNDPLYRSGPGVTALGIDGRPLTLPTVRKQLSYVGNPVFDESESKRPVGFEAPPADWKPWDPVALAVGDLPVFSDILGDGVTPFQGPAALIGLDLLAQRRVVLGAGTSNSRRRKVAVSPS